MAPGNLDNVLNSNRPSTLDFTATTAWLQRKQAQNRLIQGRGNVGIATNRTGITTDLQKQFTLDIPPHPSPTTDKGIPPLKGSVQHLPGADKAPRTPEFLKLSAFGEEDDSTMAPAAVTLRNIEKKYTHKKSTDGKLVTVKSDVWNKVMNDIKSLKEDNTNLLSANKKFSNNTSKLEEELMKFADIESKYAEVETELEDLKTQYETLKKSKRGKGKKGVVCRKDEQKEDVKEAITEFSKAVLFRTHKFAPPGTALTGATKIVWAGIKDKLKLDQGPSAMKLADFIEIYHSYVLTELSHRRQYCQTRCKNAADVWLQTDPVLPTVDEIDNVWLFPGPVMPPEDEEETEEEKNARMGSEQQKKHERGMKVLLWWLDQFLPLAVGLEFWGPDIRCLQLMTDKTIIAGDPSGKEKVYVTVTSEAFAHLIYANCRDKWQADFDFLQEAAKSGKRAKKPKFNKKDVTTHKHQNKWSSSNTGQVVGGGWAKEGIDYFEAMKQSVTKFREKEEKRGKPLYRMMRTLIAAANDVKLDEDGSQSSNGRKRKRVEEPAEKPIVEMEIEFIDE